MKAKELIETLKLYPEAIVCFDRLGFADEIVGTNIVPMQSRERDKNGENLKIKNFSIIVLNTK